jgi:hypothetical protein
MVVVKVIAGIIALIAGVFLWAISTIKNPNPK